MRERILIQKKKIKILWNMTRCSLVGSSNISERPVASMSHSNRDFDSDNTIGTFL